MAIRIVRLGSARAKGEGVRLGTVRLLDTLPRLSHDADFALGCYCEDERRCHRLILGQLLAEHGARIAPASAATKEK
ncbi:MAG: hypothetical protein ABI789_10190 [Usitatibacter sp.]